MIAFKSPDELKRLGFSLDAIEAAREQWEEWKNPSHCCGERGFGYSSDDHCPACDQYGLKKHDCLCNQRPYCEFCQEFLSKNSWLNPLVEHYEWNLRWMMADFHHLYHRP